MGLSGSNQVSVTVAGYIRHAKDIDDGGNGLLQIAGALQAEFFTLDEGYLIFSDGTILHATNGHKRPGFWSIDVIKEGSLLISVHRAPAKEWSIPSDKAFFAEGISSVCYAENLRIVEQQ